jgi:5-methylcytosine-specific restriction endonuclease McrA
MSDLSATVAGMEDRQTCWNCDAQIPPAERPHGRRYCRPLCKKIVSRVREYRSLARQGRLYEPNVQRWMDQHLAELALGLMRTKVPEKTRKVVLAANGGLCVKCKEEPAVEVDHIASDSPDPSNLQGLCRPCHQEKTAERNITTRQVAPGTVRPSVAELLARIESPTPLQESDDIDNDLSWDDDPDGDLDVYRWPFLAVGDDPDVYR